MSQQEQVTKATNPTSTAVNGGLPMSLQGALYEAMSTMANYSLKMQQSMQQYQREYLEAFGGWSKNKEGELTLNTNNGVIARFLNTSIDAANEQGQAIRNEAIGSIVAGACGAATLLGTGVAALRYRDPENDANLKDAHEFQQNLNKASDADEELADEELPTEGPLTEKVTKRIEEWASGDKSKLANFAARNKDGSINEEEAQINKDAAQHLRAPRGDKYDKVCKNLDEYKTQLRDREAALNQKFNQASNILNQVSNASSSISQGGANMAKANQTVEAQSDQARADVLKTVQGQMSNSIDDAKQRMNSFGQQSLDYAGLYGQLAQVRG